MVDGRVYTLLPANRIVSSEGVSTKTLVRPLCRVQDRASLSVVVWRKEWVELSGSLVDIQEGWSVAPLRPSLPLFLLVLCLVCVCVCLAGEPGDDTHRTTQFFLRKLNRENFNLHMCNSVCVLSITMASCKG